jgi:hypothetical protein
VCTALVWYGCALIKKENNKVWSCSKSENVLHYQIISYDNNMVKTEQKRDNFLNLVQKKWFASILSLELVHFNLALF